MEDENLEDDYLWYKDAIIYEVHIRAFYDSDNDGIGDFKGLTQKLDYLKDLGINTIWLLPFYPSPLKDDGYDIADYFNVNTQYGTLREFKEFLREAHERGIRVITELVLNHTSDKHNWFQLSKKALPKSKWRDFYVWSDTPEKYKYARIIFKDFESSNWSFDHLAKSYYWHRFYSHQPDLNFESPNVQKAMNSVVNFWLKLGVDGLRLDAVPYLFEKEGTNCENLPETHLFLQKLRKHIDSNFKNRMLLAEANQWPEDAVSYFGKENECNMAYHFPLMPRMFMAIQREDRFPIIDILDHTPQIPEKCQWALFLRNHDELTLEMVTDEERDYMYRVYAKDKHARINLGIRRRLAPLLGNDRRKIELINVLLLTMPGTPVIYYGDEIGMGDNYYFGDRNGVRTPMQWSADKNAGFSKTNPQKLYLSVIIDPEYHYETINVENQLRNQSSLLWWMKKIIAIRKKHMAFGRGKIKFLFPESNKILAFTRSYDGENVLIAVNLSRYPQVAELNLAEFAGLIPQEVFGGVNFPQIKQDNYALSFGPYSYYIFDLKKQETFETKASSVKIKLNVNKGLKNMFKGKNKEKMECEILPKYIKNCRWFGGKSHDIEKVEINDTILILDKGKDPQEFYILLLNVLYKEELPETYLLPVAYSSGDFSKQITENHPQALIAQVVLDKSEGIIHDAVYDEKFRKILLQLIKNKRKIKGSHGILTGYPRKNLKKIIDDNPDIKSDVVTSEQSNTSIIYGDVIIMKLFRRVEEGINPELEIGDQLTKQSFSNIPKIYGDFRYLVKGSDPIIVATLHELIKNQGEAWKLCIDEVSRYYERVLSQKDKMTGNDSNANIIELSKAKIPEQLHELIGQGFLDLIGTLGKRTAEFHIALTKEKENPNFEPEHFNYMAHVSLSQALISYADRILQLASRAKKIDGSVHEELNGILAKKSQIVGQYKSLAQKRIKALKIRIHGDYHLGQVLFTGKDFVIIDFEGEPARSLTDRQLKRSPLRDVAGMIRSFHYAAYMGLFKHTSLNPEDVSYLEKYADVWYKYISAAFLRSYLDGVKNTEIIPKEKDIFEGLLTSFLLDKALYELGYELNNRPDWVIIPIRGIQDILDIHDAKQNSETK